MATLPYLLPPPPLSYLSLLFLLRILPTIMSQDPISSSPTIAQCTTSLLPLTSCAPFVQGFSLMPPMPCCDNLRQVYSNVPHCLCLLLNGSTLSAFPINTTRALRLPALCSLDVNISTCSAFLVPPSSQNSQASPGVITNSTVPNATVSASPMDQPTPKPSIMGLGMGRVSGGFKLRVGVHEFIVVIAMKTFLSLLVL